MVEDIRPKRRLAITLDVTSIGTTKELLEELVNEMVLYWDGREEFITKWHPLEPDNVAMAIWTELREKGEQEMKYIIDLYQADVDKDEENVDGSVLSLDPRDIIAVRDAGKYREVFTTIRSKPFFVYDNQEDIVKEWKKTVAYGGKK